MTTLVISLALIAANAFYVAAEFGAVGVRRSRVRRLSEDGNIFARRLLPFVEDAAALDRYVAASQIGITLSSLILGAYAQATLALSLVPAAERFLHLTHETAVTAALGTVLFVLTAVQVVVAELIPKTIALQFPTQVALATVFPMRWSLRAFKPFIAFLNGAATSLLRLFGGDAATHRHLHSPQEISLLIAESRDGGLLEADEHKRLQRALQLGVRTAGDLMVPLDRVSMLSATTAWEDVARAVASSSFSRLPVYRGTRHTILGVVRVKDLVRRVVSDAGAIPASGFERLIRPVPTIDRMLAADRIIGVLRAKRAHVAIVADPGGTPVGLITIHDVVRELLGSTPAAAAKTMSTREAIPTPKAAE